MSKTPDPLAWWREARFGLFIHWGLYAVPAGFWKGKAIPSIGEWIMRNAKIPLDEYAALAKEFNPVKFNAEEWVSVAAKAGMKYLVITAKHHDGFAMFKSDNPYNIVDATPYKHDVMKNLAEACARHGLRMCFYYSQDQDWAAPGASGHWEEAVTGNWSQDKPDPARFAQYLEDKVKPQLRELLTNYGPIGLIWFDTPVAITTEQSQGLKDFVHSLQPDCLVSGRVGHDLGDYGSLGDNQIPSGPVQGEWETPATMNDTWGFKSDDHNWKSVKDLLYLLVDLTSKGVNYLLNVGPTAEGLIPQPSVDRLLEIGKWMDVNGEAIHGSGPNPWPYEFDWGRVTCKDNKLYLLFYKQPKSFKLYGLRNKVTNASVLGSSALVPYEQNGVSLSLDLPAFDAETLVPVVAVEFDGTLDVDTSIFQDASGQAPLPAYLADRGDLTLSRAGIITGWKDLASSLKWTFKLSEPGEFAVRVIVGSNRHNTAAAAGHVVKVTVAGQEVSGTLTSEEAVDSPRAQYFPEFVTTVGTVRLAEPGEVSVVLTAEAINPDAPEGLSAAGVELVPV